MIKNILSKYKTINWLLIIFILIAYSIFFTGCSSSDDDNKPTKTTYNLYDPSKFNTGYRKTATNLSGSDTSGYSYSGTYSTETQNTITLNGQDVIPILINLSFTTPNPDIPDKNIEETAYYINASVPHSIISDNTEYRPDAGMISELPATGKIGDSGILTSWTGDDGSKFSGTWIVEDGGNGLADVVESYTFIDASGAIESNQEIVLTVNESGNPQKIYIILDYPDPLDITITLEGDLN